MEYPHFEMSSTPSPFRGHARYIIGDHAFRFEMDLDEKVNREGTRGKTSFVIGTLQLEVAVDSCICLYIWGYCPMAGWIRCSLSPPVAQGGALRVTPEEPLVTGVSIGLENMVEANAWFDPDSGWFCMGKKEVPSGTTAVEFATGCVAVLSHGRLSSFWIRPENWKELAP
jgi:hypothetical protein